MSDDTPVTQAPEQEPPSGRGRDTGGMSGMRDTMSGHSFIPAGKFAECGDCSGMVLAEFAKSFDKSARRWELIVYPSLFAFIILAMYGFFLIYSLTQDIRTMASSIDPKMGVNMGSLSGNIAVLSNNIELMSTHLEYISDNMETMSVDMQNMSENIEHMTENVQVMSKSVSGMGKDVGNMNRTMTGISTKLDVMVQMNHGIAGMNQAIHAIASSVHVMTVDLNGATRPMSYINRFMPW